MTDTKILETWASRAKFLADRTNYLRLSQSLGNAAPETKEAKAVVERDYHNEIKNWNEVRDKYITLRRFLDQNYRYSTNLMNDISANLRKGKFPDLRTFAYQDQVFKEFFDYLIGSPSLQGKRKLRARDRCAFDAQCESKKCNKEAPGAAYGSCYTPPQMYA